jgi:hypothetical protein
MLLYRFEHIETGKGIYVCGVDVGEKIRHVHNNNVDTYPSARPMIFDLVRHNYTVGSDCICACASKRKLFRWFKGFLKDIRKEKLIVLAVYEVNARYTESDGKQVVFIKHKSKLVERIQNW